MMRPSMLPGDLPVRMSVTDKRLDLLTPNAKRLSTMRECSSKYEKFIRAWEDKKVASAVPDDCAEQAPQTGAAGDGGDCDTDDMLVPEISVEASSDDLPPGHRPVTAHARQPSSARPDVARQAHSRSSSRPSNVVAVTGTADSEAVRTAQKRSRICDEIISSERKYVANLQNLIRVFIAPLKTRERQLALGITPETVQNLFANVEVSWFTMCSAAGESANTPHCVYDTSRRSLRICTNSSSTSWRLVWLPAISLKCF